MALDLIEPQIPDAQKNLAPSLLLEGIKAGLGAAAHFAQIRREQESEVLRLAAQERISRDQHDFEREKLKVETGLRQQVIDAQKTELTSHAGLFDAEAEYYRGAKTQQAEQKKADLERKTKWNESMAKTWNDFNERQNYYKLNDADFMSKDPGKFADNVLDLKEEFDHAEGIIPGIKQRLAELEGYASTQTIRLKGRQKPVPIWQVKQKLRDPDTHDAMMQELIDNDYIHHKPGKPEKKHWIFRNEPAVPPQDIPANPLIERTLEEAKTPFEHSKNRVPEELAPWNVYKGGTMPAPTPPSNQMDITPSPDAGESSSEDNTSSTFSPTNSDVMLAKARRAIELGAPVPHVVQRLHKFKVDPSPLFSQGQYSAFEWV